MISVTGKNKAFSLIELMVTLVIVSVGLIFVLKAYSLCGQYIANAQNRMQGVLVLENLLGEFREKALSDGEEAIKPGSGKEKAKGREFNWTKEVSGWEVPLQGFFANLALSEDEPEAGSTSVGKKITQVQFGVSWKVRGKLSAIKMHTLMIQ